MSLVGNLVFFTQKQNLKRLYQNNTKKQKGEIMASRRLHAIKIHTKLAEDTKRRVLNCITGVYLNEYIKPNGTWNVTKIAKESGTSRPTVIKYLKSENLWRSKW